MQRRCTGRSTKRRGRPHAAPGARRSPKGLREPVNRHTTMRLAKPSTALPSAHPIKEIEPATNPCQRPITPSAHIHSRLAHASQRAQRAARSVSRSHTTGVNCALADALQHVLSTNAACSPVRSAVIGHLRGELVHAVVGAQCDRLPSGLQYCLGGGKNVDQRGLG